MSFNDSPTKLEGVGRQQQQQQQQQQHGFECLEKCELFRAPQDSHKHIQRTLLVDN